MKIWAYLALATLILGAGGFVLRSSYNMGYDKRDLEVQREVTEATQKVREEEEKRWRASVIAATEAIVVEERIVERIRVVEKEIPKIVKEYTPSECRDLGPEYAGLRNSQIRASNGVQTTPDSPEFTD